MQYFRSYLTGRGQGFWQMVNAAGTPFGQRVWAGIVVTAPTPVPPLPTASLAPNSMMISFTVDQATILVGQGVTFRWTTQNASAVYFYPQGQDYKCCARAAIGAETAYPQSSATWELRVEDGAGGVEVRPLFISVLGNLTPTPTQIISDGSLGPTDVSYFNATPIGKGCVTLQWSIQGQLSSVGIQRDGQPIGTPQSASGNINDCPGTGTRVYTLIASGSSGSAVSTARTVSAY